MTLIWVDLIQGLKGLKNRSEASLKKFHQWAVALVPSSLSFLMVCPRGIWICLASPHNGIIPCNKILLPIYLLLV